MKLLGRSPTASKNNTNSDTPGRQGGERGEEEQSHLPVREKKELSPAPAAAGNGPPPVAPVTASPLASSTPAKAGGKVREEGRL